MIAIKTNYNSLTKVEKKIADYIIANSEEALRGSVADVANGSGAAKSAVVRFCKAVGFEGFNDFKLSLAMELSKNKQLNYTPYIDENDNAGRILDKVFAANIKTLHDTAENIDRATFAKVIDALAKARSVYVYGVGTSAAIVQDFQYRLMLLGLNAFCYTDVPTMKISTLNITKDDVAIGISHSGRTVATLDAVSLARDKGALTVCLTTFADSEIAGSVDYPLIAYCDEINYPVEAVSARLAHISILDAIAITLSAKKYDETRKRAEEVHKLVNTIRR